MKKIVCFTTSLFFLSSLLGMTDPAPHKSFEEKKKEIIPEQRQLWVSTLEKILQQGTENLSAQQRAMISHTLNTAHKNEIVVNKIVPILIKNNENKRIQFDLLKTSIEAQDSTMVAALLKHINIISSSYIEIAQSKLYELIEKVNKEDADFFNNFKEKALIVSLLQKSQRYYYRI